MMDKSELLNTAKPILFNTDMVRALLDNRKTNTRRIVKFADNRNPNWSGYIKDGLTLYNGNNEPCNKPTRYNVGDILYVRETWSVASGYPAEFGFDVAYLADSMVTPCMFGNVERYNKFCKYEDKLTWQPALFMPKEAARIFLRITDARLERLQNITEEQAQKEGIERLFDDLSEQEYNEWAKRVRETKTQAEWGWKNYLWHGHFGTYGTGNKLSDAWYYQGSAYENARDSFSSLWNLTIPLKQWDMYGWNANPWVWVYEFERIANYE